MALEYARALLLTIIFIAVNFLTGLVLFSFAAGIAGTGGYERWEKVLMALPFLAATGMVLLPCYFWFRDQPALWEVAGLDLDRPLPPDTRPRGLLRAPEVLILLLLVLPAAFQILGTELETLSRIVFDFPDFYRALMDLMRPKDGWPDTLGAILTLGIIGPVCEELLFRGVVLGPLLRKARGWILPVLFQAFLFACAHMNPWQFAYALPMGVFLGWLRLRSGSLVPPILLHCANNLSAVALVYLAPTLPYLNPPEDLSIVHMPFELLGGALVAFVLAMFLLRRRLRLDRLEAERGSEEVAKA